MRNIASLVAIPLILAVAEASSFAGVTCKSSDGTFHSKHSFTQGQCEADSDGSGAKSISHGNGAGSNGYASSQTLGLAKATGVLGTQTAAAGTHTPDTPTNTDDSNKPRHYTGTKSVWDLYNADHVNHAKVSLTMFPNQTTIAVNDQISFHVASGESGYLVVLERRA